MHLPDCCTLTLFVMLATGVAMMILGLRDRWTRKYFKDGKPADKIEDSSEVRELCQGLKMKIERTDGKRAYLAVPFFNATIVELTDRGTGKLLRVKDGQEVECGTINPKV